MITFEYEGKIYKPSNLENKLKKLGITIDDVKIIDDTKTKIETIQENYKPLTNNNLEIYWDTICKGWFINKIINKEVFQTVLEKERYIFIGNTDENNLNEFIREHYKDALKLH